MGCDIHVKIEKRIDGVWTNVPWTSADARTYGYKHDPTDALEVPDYFDARNYNLFAILAGVRQGTWGDNIPPIAEPRDIPEDSPMFHMSHADMEYSLGDHSFSFVTLRELLDYDWNATYTYHASVSKEQADAMLLTGGPPTEWCAYGTNKVPVSWEATRRHAVHEWPDLVLPVLQQLGDPDNVRLVFGFDS